MTTSRLAESRTYEPIVAWTPATRVMEPEHAKELSATGAVRVEIADPPDSWRLQPDSRVGVLTGDGWELRIRPRLDIPKLLFLLAYSARPEGWRDMVAGFQREDELLEAVAAGFAWHAERALEQGVLRGYVNVDERRPDLRGRIRFADQLARSPGVPLPLEVTYDDFTADIAENRLVLSAAELLLQFRRIPPRARSRLLRTRVILDEVTRLDSPGRARAPAVTRLNARYGPALVLAELILGRRSIAPDAGDVSATTFLFDLNEVFESFLTTALREALRPYGGEVRSQFADYLDEGRVGLGVKPDITWWKSGRCLAAMDAKYKSVSRGGSIPNADAYQMLAYCIAFGIPRGYLIYAKDENERSRTHVIRRHGYQIHVRAVDVEAEPEALLAEITRLAGDISHALEDAASVPG
jgi:5-methylcytosine-specific restriction enzyme subunit McrC